MSHGSMAAREAPIKEASSCDATADLSPASRATRQRLASGAQVIPCELMPALVAILAARSCTHVSARAPDSDHPQAPQP
jgi:hypothetical protein